MPEIIESFKEPAERTPQPRGAVSSEMAENIFKEAVERDPGDAGKHCKLADIYRREQKFSLAEAEYKEAIRLDPRNDIYHWSLGQFYEYETDKLVLAEAAYKEALRLFPENPHNRLCLGRVYEKQGKLAQAESEYRILAESSPAYGDLVARICEKLGKTEAAIEQYGRVSEQPETVVRAGEMTGRSRRPSLVIMVVAAVAVLAVFGVMGWVYKGKEADYTARLEKAESDKRTISRELRDENTTLVAYVTKITGEMDRLTDDADASKYLVSASECALLGRPDEAIEELKTLVQTDPTNSLAYYWLGDLYRRKGQIEHAKVFYLNASSLGYEEADVALKAIEAAAAVRKAAPLPKKPNKTPPPKKQADLTTIREVYESSFLGKGHGLSGISHSSSLLAGKEDILKFVSGLAEYEGREGVADTGLFLSGLINNLEEDEDVDLDLTYFVEPLNYLGTYLRSRNLTIKGNVGLFLGRSMHSGAITVSEGDAGACAGRSMEGGEILINGSAGESVGYFMQSGKITVGGSAGRKAGDRMEGGEILIKGDAGELVGANMSGGAIRLEGGYKSLSEKITGGEIYHQGTKIYPGD